MVTDNHYRWDFIQLSTDVKPTPATSPKVADGSTLYTSDDSKLYVWYKDQWYEKTVEGGGISYTAGDGIDITDSTISVDTETIQPKLTAGTNITIDEDNVISSTGGSSVNVVQTTGTSTTDVMSQDAATKMVYADPDTKNKIAIGNNSTVVIGTTRGIAIGPYTWTTGEGGIAIGAAENINYATKASGSYAIAVGRNSSAGGDNSVAIGLSTVAAGRGSVSIGYGASASSVGEVNIGSSGTYYGYNSSNYRLLTGLYDPQSAHDAATKGYVDNLIATLEARIAALEGN